MIAILPFMSFTFIEGIDGTESKAIISTDRIDRIVEFNNTSDNMYLEQAKSILFFKTEKGIEDYRYLRESVDEINSKYLIGANFK